MHLQIQALTSGIHGSADADGMLAQGHPVDRLCRRMTGNGLLSAFALSYYLSI